MPSRTAGLALALWLAPWAVTAQVRVGGEFRVNLATAGNQFFPRVAADAYGRFVVVWEGPGQGDNFGIFGPHFAPDLIFLDGFD